MAPFISNASSIPYLYVTMFLNYDAVAIGLADDGGNSTSTQYDPFSFQSTLTLKKGDRIWVQLQEMYPGAYLYGSKFTHFIGHLLEESLEVA